jgi:hypothetical protein
VPESPQVRGHVERCATQPRAVGEEVPEQLADTEDRRRGRRG